MRLLVIFLSISSFLQAQEKVFTEQQLLEVVRQYHPIARQVALNVEASKADVLIARGAFDPVVSSANRRKEMEGLLYYSHRQHEVRIPTWYGIEVRTGVESLSGEKTNPEHTQGTISYIGVSVPLLRNMIMDKRRAELQQSKLLRETLVLDQQRALNDLYYEAVKAYRGWWQQHQLGLLFKEAITVAERRLALVRTAYRQGERPAIDTLEAFAQLQAFHLKETEVSLEKTKAQLSLSLFLWTKEGDPYELPGDAVPEPLTATQQDTAQLESFLAAVQEHPELRQYRYKLPVLQLDKQLSFQSLLPSLTLHYNQLGRGIDFKEILGSPWHHNNYRFGFTLSVPLRLSEGRGYYHKARLKLQGARLEQMAKKTSLETKVKQSFAQWEQARKQLRIQHAIVGNYQHLQRGEEIKFLNGESSLFLINSREAQTLSAREKLIELTAKEGLAFYGLLWAAGRLIAP